MAKGPHVVFSVVHLGEPISKARARVARGKAYTPENTRAAQEALSWAVRLSLPRPYQIDAESFFSVEARFYVGSWQRLDVDNLMKLVLDACTGLVWKDDVQVVEIHGYVTRQDPSPRSEITVCIADDPHHYYVCERCGKNFKSPKSIGSKARFCSLDCRKTVVQIPCSGCGTAVARKPPKVNATTWCSDSCRRRAIWVTRDCEWCGVSTSRPKSQYKGRKHCFCSVKCSATFYTNLRKVNASGTCADCGKRTSKKTYMRCQRCAVEVKRAG